MIDDTNSSSQINSADLSTQDECASSRWDTALPSEYGIRRAVELLTPGDAVVLFARASHHQQSRRGNLRRQQAHLRDAAEAHRWTVAEIIATVASGQQPGIEFDRAVMSAQRHGARAIVAESTDRYVRSAAWRSDVARRRSIEPARHGLSRLIVAADGVQLATLIDPDAGYAAAHAAHIRRGQEMSGQTGGRPRAESKKQRRERLRARALELRAAGMSYRGIEAQLGGEVSSSTIRDWVGGGGLVSESDVGAAGGVKIGTDRGVDGVPDGDSARRLDVDSAGKWDQTITNGFETTTASIEAKQVPRFP